jgi:protein-disulfide isomerase
MLSPSGSLPGHTGEELKMSIQLSLIVTDRDHVQGRHDAPVTWLEYGDYECPHCGRAHAVVQAVQRHLGAAVRFAFRNFPLRDLHAHAELAARAAEAAALQGRFWEMHDLLLTHQRALERAQLRGYAAELGLDLARWEHDLDGPVSRERVQADLISGVEHQVRGTPTFFINAQPYLGVANERELLLALEAAIHQHSHPHG